MSSSDTSRQELAAMGMGVVLFSGLTISTIGAIGFLLWMVGLQ